MGEVFEETQLDCDQVDQMMALFLAITPEKVKHAQELENKALQKKKSVIKVERKQTIKVKQNSVEKEMLNQINAKLNELI